MTIDEINIHEVNRIGKRLEDDLNLLSNTLEQTAAKKKNPITDYINTYLELIKKHNLFVRETNSYLQDHIVKYYQDTETKELSYRKLKKERIGYL